MKLRVACGVVSLLCLAVQPAAELASAVVESPGELSSPTPEAPAFTRVRSDEPGIAQLLTDGQRRSPTLKRLIQTIDASDLLVYVLRWVSSSTVGGSVEVMGAANGQRVVFILINSTLSSVHATAMIAHELQHAVEIANAPEVVDHASLVRHYERIGTPIGFGRRSRSYETDAARAVGNAVLVELLNDDGLEAGT